MSESETHISVCICTYQRPDLLGPLLAAVEGQKTAGLFSHAIVVVDNDVERSAESVVGKWKGRSHVDIKYCVEPAKNIAIARNTALANAEGDFLAFIDDDEVPDPDWLVSLLRVAHQSGAEAVLGPVKARFATEPPEWVVRAGLFERPSYPTGTPLSWNNTRTGNVLLRRAPIVEKDLWFRPEFRHSEDQDFFKRFMAHGYRAVWCDEAIVYEVEREERFSVRYFVRRALLRGNVSVRLSSNLLVTLAKSLVALPLYTIALPVLGMIRKDLFIKYLIKDCDHAGKLLAMCRIDVQKYLA